MSRNQEYAEKYAEYAMEQQRRYGIPASVTLAQGILESSNGQSELSRKGNNHFGIKATSAWLEDGGSYLVYKDDRPNEKFCSYASVADSYEHHSQFLKENARYSDCFKLAADDWKGWAQGLEDAGYATAEGYADKLKSIIERNGLDRYDRMAAEDLQQSETEILNTGKDMPVSEEKMDDAGLTDEDWMKKLLSSEDGGIGLGPGDPIVQLMVTLYSGLMALAMQIDGKSTQEHELMADEAVATKRIDLTPLMPSMKKCSLDVSSSQHMVLDVVTKDVSFSHVMTAAETARIAQILGNDSMSDDMKRQRVAQSVNMAITADYVSQCFEKGLENGEQQGLRR